jgi:hypothetical protein
LVIHVAGEPIGNVQRCSRCGAILLDYTDAKIIASTGRTPRWWTGNVFVTTEESGETDEAPTCQRMRVTGN